MAGRRTPFELMIVRIEREREGATFGDLEEGSIIDKVRDGRTDYSAGANWSVKEHSGVQGARAGVPGSPCENVHQQMRHSQHIPILWPLLRVKYHNGQEDI